MKQVVQKTRKPKIVMVCTQMEAAGVQIIAGNMHMAFMSEGIDSELVFLYKKRSVFESVDGITCLLAAPPKGVFDYVKVIFRLWKYVGKRRPTAILGFADYASILAAFMGLVWGVKTRVATQTNPPSSLGLKRRLVDKLFGTLGIYTSNIAASKMVYDCFSNYPRAYRRKLRMVYNGVLWQAAKLNKSEIREKLNLPQNAQIIVTCGRLSYQKNHQFLLEVLELLPDVILVIIGEGELRADLEADIAARQFENRVRLIGEVPPNEISDHLNCGDVFVFPSRYEAFGLAVVEAMMAGLPVVSSDHQALREIVGEAGVLLPIEAPELWAEEILLLLHSSDKRRIAAKKATKRASVFSFDAMLTGFKNILFGSNH